MSDLSKAEEQLLNADACQKHTTLLTTTYKYWCEIVYERAFSYSNYEIVQYAFPSFLKDLYTYNISRPLRKSLKETRIVCFLRITDMEVSSKDMCHKFTFVS